MKKLIQYIFALAILISLVHITKDIVEFSREIIILKNHQLAANIKEQRMMHPTVKVTSLAPFGPPESGGAITLSSATGFSVKYNITENYSVIVTNDHFCSTPYPGMAFIVEDYTSSSVEKSNKYFSCNINNNSHNHFNYSHYNIRNQGKL